MAGDEQEHIKHDRTQGQPSSPIEPKEEKMKFSKSETPKKKPKPTQGHEETARMLARMIVDYRNAKSPRKAVKALEIEPRSRFPYYIVEQHKRLLNSSELEEFKESRKRLDLAIPFLWNGRNPAHSPAFGYFAIRYNHAFRRLIQTAEDGSMEEVEVYAHRYRRPGEKGVPRGPGEENVPTFLEALSYCVYKFFSLKESAGLLGRCQNQYRHKISKDKYERCKKFYLADRRFRKEYCGKQCREKHNRIGKRLEEKKRKALKKTQRTQLIKAANKQPTDPQKTE